MADQTRVLADHERWLESGEQAGERADFSGGQLSGQDFANANLRGALFNGAVLDGVNFSGAQLVHANFTEANLNGANLQGANLLLADFTGADLAQANLSSTTLDASDRLGHVRRGPRFKDANLHEADLRRASCYMSDFSGARLQGTKLATASLEGAHLSGAQLDNMDLSGVDLSGADLTDTNLHNTTLRDASLARANLARAVLTDADVSGANLASANLAEARVDGIRYDRNTRFRGIRAFSCYGSSRFKRFAEDQDFIEEFRESHPGFYWIWFLLTDCGRSMSRVVVWSVAFILLFSAIYFALGNAAFAVSADGLTWSLFTTTYYSVVTFTTLGFGDITPNTQLAAGVVMIEVIVGYVMLGILISILATKVARRS